jgi:hypothetical protein
MTYHERHSRDSATWSAWIAVSPDASGKFTISDSAFAAGDTVTVEVFYVDAAGNPSVAQSGTVNIT